MKQIIENRYLKGFKFSSSEEASTFCNNQKAKRSISIEDTFGENYYCYVCYHSLTKEKQFVLSFRSDESEDNLNFLFWDNLFVMDTGKNVYLINKEKLLLLEEVYMRVVDYKGQIVKSELFDLIEDFSIKGNLLSVQTSEERRVIELT